jgi:ribosomal protein S20
MQPQLDLHSRLHNLGTYRVKAPGRSPLGRPRWKEQGVAPLMADPTVGAGDSGRRSSVKAGLTPNRRQRRVENDEYASFIRRVIRAHAKRIAAGDVDALADMTGLATELDEAIAQAVLGLREAGYSWADIAARLGVSRQAAQQRWGQR